MEELHNTTYDGRIIDESPVVNAATEECPAESPETKGWFDIFSNIMSWVLVPIMMPVYGILLIFHFSTLEFVPWTTRLLLALVVLGINCVFSAVCFYFLKMAGVIEDIGLNGRKERLIPYILTIANLCITAWFFHAHGAPFWVSLFYFGGAAGAAVNLVVNFWWKISAHAAGMAGLVALMAHLWRDGISSADPFWWLIGIILATGLLGACRIWLGRHTWAQVLAGYAVGFAGVWLMMQIPY